MKLRKLLAAVVAIGAIACTSAFAASVTLVPSKTEVEIDEVFTIDVVLADNPGLLNWGMKANVTGGLEMTKKATTTVAGATFDNTVGFPYAFACLEIAGDGSNWMDNGTIATFTVKATEAGTWTFSTANNANVTCDENYDPVDLPSASCNITVKSAAPAFAYTLSDAAAGADVGEQATYYTTVTVNTPTAGARFQVANGGETKSWELPSICGSGKFVAIVGTNGATGTFANSIVVDGVAVSNVVNY